MHASCMIISIFYFTSEYYHHVKDIEKTSNKIVNLLKELHDSNEMHTKMKRCLQVNKMMIEVNEFDKDKQSENNLHKEIKMKNLRIEEMNNEIDELSKHAETLEKHIAFRKVKKKNDRKKRKSREVSRNRLRYERI